MNKSCDLVQQNFHHVHNVQFENNDDEIDPEMEMLVVTDVDFQTRCIDFQHLLNCICWNDIDFQRCSSNDNHCFDPPHVIHLRNHSFYNWMKSIDRMSDVMHEILQISLPHYYNDQEILNAVSMHDAKTDYYNAFYY